MPDIIKTSKFLSLILRHKPETIGLSVDKNGWAEIDTLIRLSNQSGHRLTRELIDQIVAENDKKRFLISDDRKRIRASQGHSIDIELGLTPTTPPDFLYHGTATRFIDSIRKDGLHSGSRRHVHLSMDVETAIKVGQRHGKPVVLTIKAMEMHRAGYPFFLSDNEVWLTENVPAEYISLPD